MTIEFSSDRPISTADLSFSRTWTFSTPLFMDTRKSIGFGETRSFQFGHFSEGTVRSIKEYFVLPLLFTDPISNSKFPKMGLGFSRDSKSVYSTLRFQLQAGSIIWNSSLHFRFKALLGALLIQTTQPLGQPNFLCGALVSNFTNEFDPKPNCMPIFGALEQRFTTT